MLQEMSDEPFRHLLGGEQGLARTRTVDIMSDAAHAVLTRDSRTSTGTGNFFIDEDVLREEGITDLAGYRTALGDGPLDADLFLDPTTDDGRERPGALRRPTSAGLRCGRNSRGPIANAVMSLRRRRLFHRRSSRRPLRQSSRGRPQRPHLPARPGPAPAPPVTPPAAPR